MALFYILQGSFTEFSEIISHFY